MEHVILFAGLLNISLGVITLRYGEKNKVVHSFAIFCLLTGMWVITNFAEYFFGYHIFVKLAYAFGALIFFALLAWVLFYTNPRKKSLFLPVASYVFGAFVFLVTAITNLVVAEVVKINISSVDIVTGPMFFLWCGVCLVSYIVSITLVLRAYFRGGAGSYGKNIKIIWGILGFGIFSLLVSVILPAFGILRFTNLDSISSLIFVVFAFLAIAKNAFLGTKVFLVQIFSVIMITISLVDVFYVENVSELVMRILFLFTIFVLGFSLTKSIISEIERKNELQMINAKLMELDKSKSEFISIASHQLRTPLTSMKGFISIMKNGSYGKLPRKLEEPIGHIETANERLISLVKNMLDISRIEAGGMAFEFKKEDLGALADELHQSFLPIAKEKNVSMELEIQKGLPKIKIDYVKVRELISNIIDNAIKYTEKGNIKIALKKKKDSVQVAVSDTGIGISEKELKGLFDKFFRGKKARQLKKNGSGLGLYLGRKIVEAHGGKIYARSKGSSKGSTFFVELPIG